MRLEVEPILELVRMLFFLSRNSHQDPARRRILVGQQGDHLRLLLVIREQSHEASVFTCHCDDARKKTVQR